MNELLQNLIKLQSLEFEKTSDKAADPVIAELRGKIPSQILGHYDRLVAHGKKGLAAVRGQVCTGCHMSLPIGVITTLMRGDDIQLCDSCGRYLYLAEEMKEEAPKPAAKPTRAKKPRKSKSSLPLV
jgi:predicted  nucleic acid-binding Zn-ribbon protein